MTRHDLLTIGYEGCVIDGVLATLKEAGIGLLIDVRAVAASRKPGFSKRQLAAGLDAAGIGYVHLRPLGTPKPGRDAVRSGHAGYIADALGVIAKARGMTAVARDAGITREALYRSLSADGDPRLSTLLAVIKALGLTIDLRKRQPERDAAPAA